MGHAKQSAKVRQSGDVLDPDLEDMLKTGVVRFHGVKGWAEIMQYEIVRDGPVPFNPLGVNYKLRF